MDGMTPKQYAEDLAVEVAKTMENIAKQEGREVDFEVDFPAAMIIVFAEELYVLADIVLKMKGTSVEEISSIPQKPKTYLH